MISIRQILEARKKPPQDLSYLTSSSESDDDEETKKPSKAKTTATAKSKDTPNINSKPSVTSVNVRTPKVIPIPAKDTPTSTAKLLDPSKLDTMSNIVSRMKSQASAPQEPPQKTKQTYRVTQPTLSDRRSPKLDNTFDNDKSAYRSPDISPRTIASNFDAMKVRADRNIAKMNASKKATVGQNLFGNKLDVKVPPKKVIPNYSVNSETPSSEPRLYGSTNSAPTQAQEPPASTQPKYRVVTTTPSDRRSPKVSNTFDNNRSAHQELSRSTRSTELNHQSMVVKAQKNIAKMNANKKDDVQQSLFGNKLAVKIPSAKVTPSYSINTDVPSSEPRLYGNPDLRRFGRTPPPPPPKNPQSPSTSSSSVASTRASTPPNTPSSPVTNTTDYDASFHNGLIGNKLKTITKSNKSTIGDMNLLAGRKHEKEQKTFGGFKKGTTSKSQGVSDMNLLSGRKYQQQSDMDKKNAEMSRQKAASRIQDRKNYMKIKSVVKPHLDKLAKKAMSRNYWHKDIKPGLETIANAFRR